MRPRTGQQTDNPPIGGSKSLELSNIIPFVAEPVDDRSIEDMRNNLDRQLKRIAEVTLALKGKIEETPVVPPEPGGSGVTGVWKEDGAYHKGNVRLYAVDVGAASKDHSHSEYLEKSDKGKPGGVASLGSDGKVPDSQLPDSASGSFVKKAGDEMSGGLSIYEGDNGKNKWTGTQLELSSYNPVLRFTDISSSPELFTRSVLLSSQDGKMYISEDLPNTQVPEVDKPFPAKYRIYHEGYKPSYEGNYVKLSGDKMTGTLSTPRLSFHPTSSIHSYITTESSQKWDMLLSAVAGIKINADNDIAGGDVLELLSGSNSLQIYSDGSTQGLNSLTYNGNIVYHAGNLPTSVDSYTKVESDERFVNVTGDTMTGSLQLSGETSQLFVASQYLNTPPGRIDFAIGDSDTGFNWQSDGVLDLYANNRIIGEMGINGFKFNNNTTVTSGDLTVSTGVLNAGIIKLRDDLSGIRDDENIEIVGIGSPDDPSIHIGRPDKQLRLDGSTIHARNALEVTTGNLTMRNGDIYFPADNIINWARLTDCAQIGFHDLADGSQDTYMHFTTCDNGYEFFKFRHRHVGGEIDDWVTINKDNIYYRGNALYHAANLPPATIDSESEARITALENEVKELKEMISTLISDKV